LKRTLEIALLWLFKVAKICFESLLKRIKFPSLPPVKI
jgi:hypothetical protein